MQFPASSCLAGIEGFEELNRCGDDDGHIPVLRGSGHEQGFLLVGTVVRVIEFVRVMFQYILSANGLSKDVRGLVNDGRIGNDVNDPREIVLDSVLQCEGKRRNGFSAAGGNSQCKQAFFQRFSLLVAYVQNLLPAFVQDVGWHLPWGGVLVQVLKQYVEVRGTGWTGFSVKKGFRIQKISVHQTGEYHSDIHGNLFSVLLREAGRNDGNRWDFRLVGAVVRNHVGAFSFIPAF